jgi:hypothetical protein
MRSIDERATSLWRNRSPEREYVQGVRLPITSTVARVSFTVGPSVSDRCPENLNVNLRPLKRPNYLHHISAIRGSHLRIIELHRRCAETSSGALLVVKTFLLFGIRLPTVLLRAIEAMW